MKFVVTKQIKREIRDREFVMLKEVVRILKHPWLSTIPYLSYVLFYCLYDYLSGKFSSAKEVIGSNEWGRT